jgi:hypothetical protein
MYLFDSETAKNAKVTWNFGRVTYSTSTFPERKKERIKRMSVEEVNRKLKERSPFSEAEARKLVEKFSEDFCGGKHAPLYMSSSWLFAFDRMWRQFCHSRKHADLPLPVLGQAKQKFASARVYLDGDAECQRFATIAETVLSGICEYCGTTHNVKTRGHGWLVAACSTCGDIVEEGDRLRGDW